MKFIIIAVLVVLVVSAAIAWTRRARIGGDSPEGYYENMRNAGRPDDAEPGSPTRGPV